MSYNSTNMYSGYNKNTNRGALVGNWVEENALEQETGSSRGINLTNPKESVMTRERVIYHTEREEARDYRSTASDCGMAAPTSTIAAPMGPRAAARAAAVAADAARIEASMDPATDERTFTTATASAHQAPPPEWYGENGRLGPADGSITKGAADAELDAVLDERGDRTVTAYSRAIDGEGGEYRGSAVAGSNPLGRCTAFTNDIRNPTQKHVGALDSAADGPTRMPPSAPQWGALDRLRRSGVAGAFDSDGGVSLDEFCDRLAELGVSSVDMQLLVSYFDGSGTGTVDLARVREECA